MNGTLDEVPLVTVCVVTRNCAAGIERAIRSVIDPAVDRAEVVVYDDGSADRTVEIVNALAAELPAVRVIAGRERIGRARSKNRLLAEARGRFVTWLDADGERYPGMLTAQLAWLASIEKARGATALEGVLVCAPYHRLRRASESLTLISPAVVGDPMEQVLGGRLAVPLWSTIGLTTTFRAAAPFDQRLTELEEVDFAIRLAELGGTFERMPFDQPIGVQHDPVAPPDARAVWADWNRIWRRHHHHFISYGLHNARYWRRQHYRAARQAATASHDAITYWRIAASELFFVVRGRFRRVIFDA